MFWKWNSINPLIMLYAVVFRTNSCWARWDEARKGKFSCFYWNLNAEVHKALIARICLLWNMWLIQIRCSIVAWGVIVNNSRSIARKSSSWIMESDLPFEEKQQLLKRVTDAVWAFARAECRHLLSDYEDEVQFQLDVRKNLAYPFASDIIRHKRHRPSFALFELSCALNELPLDMFRRNEIDFAVSELCDAMGACDRLYSSPIPKFYARHTSRFLFLWLAFLPLALWHPLGVSWNHFSL